MTAGPEGTEPEPLIYTLADPSYQYGTFNSQDGLRLPLIGHKFSIDAI
jgi:hypothetical protein